MTISAEVPVPKDVLCYVKKRGGHPASKEDGILFPFVQDFPAGRSVLPPIEIGKEDFNASFSRMAVSTDCIMSWCRSNPVLSL